MHRCRRLCTLVFGLLFAATASASANEESLPESCGTRADFERELKLRLGADAPIHTALFSIAPIDSGYHLRVQVGSELRELDDPSCTELFRAAIVIAVAILMHGRELAKEAPLPPPPAAAPPPKPSRSEYPRFTLSGGAGLSAGTLPEPALAFELEGKSLWRRWGIGIQARYLPFSSTTAADGRARLESSAVGVGSAAILRPGRRWETRVGFAVQRLSGSGSGTAHDRNDHVWAAGPTLGLGWIPLESGSLWAGVFADGQLNAVRGRFQILNYSSKLSDPYVIYPVPWLAFSTFVRLGLIW